MDTLGESLKNNSAESESTKCRSSFALIILQ